MISKVELRELAKQGIFRSAGSCGRRDRPEDKKRQSPGKHPTARTHRLGIVYRVGALPHSPQCSWRVAVWI